MDRQTGESLDTATTRLFRELAERWRAEDPTYDGETWPELKEALDRDRSSYRKLLPEDRPEGGRRPACRKR